MNLTNVETFIAVVEAGSIGGGARQLGVTQPAVTRQIQALEKELQATLFDRSSKPPTLTPAGRRALGHCRRLVRASEALRQSVSQTNAPTGHFRLGVAYGATDLVLGDPIDALRQGFSQLKIEVITNWSNVLQEKTSAGAVDAAVVLMATGRQPAPSLRGRSVGTDIIHVVGGTQQPLPAQLTVEALGDYDWVLNPKGCWYRDILQDVLALKGIPLKVAIETFGLEYQLSLIARGVGLGLVPGWAISQSAHRARLRTAQLADHPFELTIWTVRAAYLGHFDEVVDALESAIDRTL